MESALCLNQSITKFEMLNRIPVTNSEIFCFATGADSTRAGVVELSINFRLFRTGHCLRSSRCRMRRLESLAIGAICRNRSRIRITAPSELNDARRLMNLAIDARMLSRSGIGTYVSNVLPRLIPLYRGGRIHLLGERSELARLPWARGDAVSLVNCASPIFSLDEQLRLPRAIPAETDVFWSPQFNIQIGRASCRERV